MAKTPKMTIPSSKVSIALAAGSTEPAMKEAAAKSSKLYNVPVNKIEAIPGFNVRVDGPDYRAHRDAIAASIKANGYDSTKPLAGYVHKGEDGNVIYVTDGHTRLDAVKSLLADKDSGFSIDSLPVVVRSPAPSLTDLTVALHTNNTGRPLTPFELGVVVKRLMKDEGADKKAIAERLAVTPRYLDDVLLLVNAPKPVRTAVLEGDVSSTFAIQTLRKAGDSPEKAVEIITNAVTKAKASGKAKATAKDAGPKMKKVKSTVSIAEGTDMKEIVKAVAALVRKAVPAAADNTDEDAAKLATVDGTITLSIEVPVPASAPAQGKGTGDKAEARKGTKPTGKTAEPETEKPAPKKRPKKTDKPAPADEDNIPADDTTTAEDELGIEGATGGEDTEIDRTDTDLDIPAPPKLQGEDEESDI